MTARTHMGIAAAGVIVLAVFAARAATGSGDPQSMWKDPKFQRAFLGSYGINADIEPRVALEEQAVLESVLPYMSTGLPRAARILEAELKPSSSALIDYTLGNIYLQQEKLDRAQERYRTATIKFPTFRRAWRNLAMIHVRTNGFDEAIKAFTTVIELGGADAYTYGLLGFSYTSRADFLAAEAAYRTALLLQPDNLDWRLGLARAIFKQENYEEAASLLDLLIEQYPDRADFWMLQANAFLGMKKPLKAAENFEALSMQGKATADILHTLGDIYLNEQLPELASRAYVRAIEADPEQKTERPLRDAEMLALRGAPTEAKALAQTLRGKLGAGMADADRRRLLKLEARIAVSEGAGDEAVRALEEIIQVDPLDGEALMLLGQHHVTAGNTEKAGFYFERAAGMDKYEAEACLRHGQCLARGGKYQDALPLLKRAQQLRPREDVARYIEQVERVARSAN
ncbi:MAG TPA: tetratricopeptide repeat protein [Kiritimatiellia bacterium]